MMRKSNRNNPRLKRGSLQWLIAKLVKWVSIALIGYMLYRIIRPYAIAIRGNTLYGGEVLMLGLPLYWAAVEVIIKDVRETQLERRR